MNYKEKKKQETCPYCKKRGLKQSEDKRECLNCGAFAVLLNVGLGFSGWHWKQPEKKASAV